MPLLKDVATTVRSKNAGAFLVTIDVIFANEADFDRYRNSKIFNREFLSALLKCSSNHLTVIHYDKANAVKITFPRSVSSGSLADSDIYGAQFHSLIMDQSL